ncbi:MAG TPA: hypothetical protein VGR47_02595 [Terracidiphilus sp.]|nr:hypothetical protein [Terracidiphilus sp.]
MTRGRAYQQGGHVHDLAISADGKLLATVSGGRRYATQVWWEADVLHSRCTCPVGWDGCKHAVAVVAAYLDMLAKDAEVSIADEADNRWEKLASNVPEEPYEDFEDSDEAESEDGEAHPIPRRPAGKGRADDEKIRKHIDAKSREELAALVWSLTQRHPALRAEFRERIALGEGDADRLIAEARKELRRATSEPGWRNYWKGEGYTPDFGRLARYLDRMVELGHADAVVKLSREIMSRGVEMIGQSNDEGETATAFAECLPPIFRAVAKSSLPSAKKLLFAIDADLRDKYNVIESDLLDAVLEKDANLADWSAAADELARRLQSETRNGGNFHDKYQRERIADWLVRTLTRAGRDDEIIAVREREARVTGSYERLVPLLIERKLYDDAERWATEGIQKTFKDAPGIADQLAKAMGEIARLRGQWNVVAAHGAWEFFERPGREKFAALVAAAERAGCREPVERLALGFLETGKLPFSVAVKKEGAHSATLHPDWPLPLPDYLLPLSRTGDAHPHYDVLIDMAIAERRPDDVLRWFDLWCAAAKGHRTRWNFGAGSYADKVAATVAESHPERTLEIYRGCVEGNLPQASVSAYETVAAYLKKMRPILKSLDRCWEWNELVTEIRTKYRNRPRFMEILDRIEARPILQKPSRQK